MPTQAPRTSACESEGGDAEEGVRWGVRAVAEGFVRSSWQALSFETEVCGFVLVWLWKGPSSLTTHTATPTTKHKQQTGTERLQGRIAWGNDRMFLDREGTLFVAGVPLGSNNYEEATTHFVELLKVRKRMEFENGNGIDTHTAFFIPTTTNRMSTPSTLYGADLETSIALEKPEPIKLPSLDGRAR